MPTGPGGEPRWGSCRAGRSRRSPYRGGPASPRGGRRRRGPCRRRRRCARARRGYTSWCLSFRREERGDEVRGLVPFAGFPGELFPPGGRERIELRAAVVLGLPPLGLDE